MEINKEKEQSILKFTLSFAWNLGYSIAVPLVVLALGGRFLDKKFGSSPWFLIAGILISIAISSYIVYKKMKEIL